MITATAPGRCGIVGNPTDMYGGSVLSISISERAKCQITEAGALTISSGGLTERIYDEEELKLRGDMLDICRAALTYFEVNPARRRFALSLSTDVPMLAGMAGSTALVVAAVGALGRYLDLKLHPWAIAETARRIEAGIMGVLCGFQDQHMAVFGGVNFMDFAGKEDLRQHENAPLATVERLTEYVPRIPLIAAHTGVRHDSGVVHTSPRNRWLAGDPEVREAYRRIAQLAGLGKQALLAADWRKLGALMNENHAIVTRLGGSGPQNERLIEAARSAGALGAKLAGAGGGGTIIALAPEIDRVRRALLKAGADCILFPEPCPGLKVIVAENVSAVGRGHAVTRAPESVPTGAH